MTPHSITEQILAAIEAQGLELQQVNQVEQDGNVVLTLYAAQPVALKSITIHFKSEENSAAHLARDFAILKEDEGFTDHVDYVPPATPRALEMAPDEKL